jgi:hypothetical protein
MLDRKIDALEIIITHLYLWTTAQPFSVVLNAGDYTGATRTPNSRHIMPSNVLYGVIQNRRGNSSACSGMRSRRKTPAA